MKSLTRCRDSASGTCLLLFMFARLIAEGATSSRAPLSCVFPLSTIRHDLLVCIYGNVMGCGGFRIATGCDVQDLSRFVQRVLLYATPATAHLQADNVSLTCGNGMHRSHALRRWTRWKFSTSSAT